MCSFIIVVITLYLLVTCSCAYCGVTADWPVTDDMLCKSFTLSSSFTQAVRDCAKLQTKKAKITTDHTCTRIIVGGQASRPYHNSELKIHNMSCSLTFMFHTASSRSVTNVVSLAFLSTMLLVTFSGTR